MNITPFRALLPEPGQIPEQDDFFLEVKGEFNLFRSLGYFSALKTPAFYVLRISTNNLTATGLVCASLIEDYLGGDVLRHEETIPGKRAIQINLLKERQAALKPVLIIHQKVPEIQRWLSHFANSNQPVLQVEFSRKEKHSLWEVGKVNQILQIQQLFQQKLNQGVIADGHHRFASFKALWESTPAPNKNKYANVLSAYFPDHEIEIDAFHRLLVLPKNYTPEDILQRLVKLGNLNELDHPKLPTHKHQICVIFPNICYYFNWDRSLYETNTTAAPVLDITLLTKHVIKPIQKINNAGTKTKIDYVQGDNGLEKLVSKVKAESNTIGFALFPIFPEEFLQAASHRLQLVPKATYFRPRLKNGLIVQILDGVV